MQIIIAVDESGQMKLDVIKDNHDLVLPHHVFGQAAMGMITAAATQLLNQLYSCGISPLVSEEPPA